MPMAKPISCLDMRQCFATESTHQQCQCQRKPRQEIGRLTRRELAELPSEAIEFDAVVPTNVCQAIPKIDGSW